MLLNGIGLEKDAKKAVDLYKKAAEQGDVDAQSYLEDYYNKKKSIGKKIKNQFTQ